MYLHNKEVPRSRLSNIRAQTRQTDMQTSRQTDVTERTTSCTCG